MTVARLLIPSLSVFAIACKGETMDAGNTYPGQLAAKPATTRATMTAMIDAITMDDASLYFTCEDGWVYRLAKTGDAPPERLASFPGQYAWGITVDDVDVYWTALVDGVNGGLVLRAPKTGGPVSTLASSQFRPWGIAVDDADVYWITQGAPADTNTQQHLAPGSLQVLEKVGGSPRTLINDVIVGDYVVLDTDAVVWHEHQAIRRAPKAGGPASALVSTTVPFAVSNLTIMNGSLFFAASGPAWTIQTMPSGGGDPATLASEVVAPASVVVEGSNVFWSAASGSAVGAIQGVTVGGGNVSMLWPPNDIGNEDGHSASALLADVDAFYSVEYKAQPTLAVSIRMLPR
jgi:hypothetical protein